ncbi:MAG: MarR family transcriptional regulator [Proteobacteria bacterium]|nr:MarR family transcriptional regulator [Pseudomonadota bacterium]
MPETQPPSTTRVWFRLIRLHQTLYSEVATRLRVIGLSVPQFDVLSTLTEREGMSQRELAERLYVTKGNVSGLIDRLVDAGLVERRSIPEDRRSHALYLTPEGNTLALRGIEVHQKFMEETLGRLPGVDVITLDRILVSWRDVMRELASQTNP